MESFTPSTPEAPVEKANSDMVQAYKRLRNLTHCLAISLIILTGTVFIFILREIVMVRAQTKRSISYIQEFRESNLPAVMQQLQKELLDFAQKNPDFRPILARYGQPNPAATSSSPAPTNSQPASTTSVPSTKTTP